MANGATDHVQHERDARWQVTGLVACACLASGAFGKMIATETYSLPFSAGLRAVLCGGAILAAVAFFRRQQVIGALIGALTSGFAANLLIGTWRALAERGLATVGHLGWGFALTVLPGAIFLVLLFRQLITEH